MDLETGAGQAGPMDGRAEGLIADPSGPSGPGATAGPGPAPRPGSDSAYGSGSRLACTVEAARRAEYPGVGEGYLNTATLGLPPARTAAALRRALDAWAAGRPDVSVYEEAVAASRAAYARITGVPVERVALASTVAGAVGLIATALPDGAEVVVAADDFSSLVQPFAGRGGLDLRIVPLTEVAAAVRASTALVAVSAAQSADGRVADLAAIAAAARRHGARVLVDGTQSVGWLPVPADMYDYLVCHGYKWLLTPHGACFLTVREGAEDTLSPAFAGWYSAADPWADCYGPVDHLAPGARRFDTRPAYLSFVGAAASLSLIEEIGVPALHAHDVSLADSFRTGLHSLGFSPVPSPHPSAIVSVPDLPPSAPTLLTAARLTFSTRASFLRFSFHLHNTEADVTRTLTALENSRTSSG